MESKDHRRRKGLVIAGTHSGVGKTTVATGIMAVLCRKGYKVQPFKVGPDYIDPSYHGAVCGLPSRNLDTWLLERAAVVELFRRAMRDKEIAVVEGVMGLFDGFRGEDEEGSTAHVAKLLRLPVILVVDASAAARSVGALVLGFKNFDPHIELAGVILNGIAGERHLEFVKPSLEKAGVTLLGYLPKRPDLRLPERHLGLIPTVEGRVSVEFFGRLVEQVERTIDVDRISRLAAPIDLSEPDSSLLFPEAHRAAKVAIAVARDKAFNFYYPDSLDLLEAWGAEIVSFSLLEDRELPSGVGGVYIGGGFPELYARELSENSLMRSSVQRAAQRGLPIYAECGGLMYLGESIEDSESKNYPMAAVFPYCSSMKGSKLTLGYRNVSALDDNPLMSKGESVRGHEFHLSVLQGESRGSSAYDVLDQPGRKEGFRVRNTMASYIHLHLGSKRSLASSFVDFCAAWRAAT
ncbi:MAG: cobyrinate a,c-diamide synthase [Deltaproteobacteria bacterium]|nr:cobyrinate a,c-diamide synthase [Deltaproteobacteria bacterium]